MEPSIGGTRCPRSLSKRYVTALLEKDVADVAQALNGALIPELHLPGPNAFIPENLEVNKIEGKEVSCAACSGTWLTPPTARPEAQFAEGHLAEPTLAQEGR